MPDDIGKKEWERRSMEFFLAAHAHVTGRSITNWESRERPDFLCWWADGGKAGIELTSIGNDPDEKRENEVVTRTPYLETDYTSVLERIQWTIENKEEKRASDGWLLPNHAILVIAISIWTVRDLEPRLRGIPREEFFENGFEEIWLSDETQIPAFREVKLFGLKPGRYWGIHERASPNRKPFG